MWSNIKAVGCICRYIYPHSKWAQAGRPLLCVAQSKSNGYDKNNQRNLHAFEGIDNKYSYFTKTCCAIVAVSVLGVAFNFQKLISTLNSLLFHFHMSN